MHHLCKKRVMYVCHVRRTNSETTHHFLSYSLFSSGLELMSFASVYIRCSRVRFISQGAARSKAVVIYCGAYSQERKMLRWPKMNSHVLYTCFNVI